MNLKLLIDGIVRQTTVLIAQLSTASGARAPLAHLGDQVFLELAKEIEAQGVRKQVVAGMFGLAMRSYQKKMQRLTESATVRNRTLWEAVLEFVAEENPSRARVLSRFARDGERDVVAVLNDLVRSGLIYSTGSGESIVYGATSNDVRKNVQRHHDLDSLANLIWLSVFQQEADTEATLAETLGIEPARVTAAVADLLASKRLRREGSMLRSSNVVVPLGAEQGWEAAVLDHFRAVATAIASKVRLGVRPSSEDDKVSGSTYTFTVTPQHPHEREVYDLLRQTRGTAQTLWGKVAQHNNEHPPDPERSVQVSFYVGQNLQSNELSDGETEA